MPFPMMPPSGAPLGPPTAPPTMSGDAMNLGSPMSAPPIPSAVSPMDALASIKDKLGVGKQKSLPGVGFKKPVSKVAKKAISGVRSLHRKMAKKGKK